MMALLLKVEDKMILYPQLGVSILLLSLGALSDQRLGQRGLTCRVVEGVLQDSLLAPPLPMLPKLF
jgi:hypothetical protein